MKYRASPLLAIHNPATVVEPRSGCMQLTASERFSVLYISVADHDWEQAGWPQNLY